MFIKNQSLGEKKDSDSRKGHQVGQTHGPLPVSLALPSGPFGEPLRGLTQEGVNRELILPTGNFL